MSNPTGHGPLGRALIAAWGGGRKRSFTAKGWHAQISKLTEAKGGAAAAAAADLDVSRETLLKWLAQAQEPRPDNQARIARAYEILAGGVWDSANETREYRIDGTIDSGDRVQDRVLLIDGSAGEWDTIREKYEDGTLTDTEAEELFITDVIEQDIGETSPEWGFPGSSYTV